MASKARIKIIQAFETYLVKRESFDDLNVLKLSALSDVNRVTFYRQFNDILDFLKWYVLKDFIFHHKDAQPFTFKEAFLKVFSYIDNNRQSLRKIFTSKYANDLVTFVESEVLAYQNMNLNRIDNERVLSKEEMQTHASFYASGVTKSILNYLLDDRYMSIPPYDYTSFNLRLVKEYIERAIARKKAKAYDVIEETKG